MTDSSADRYNLSFAGQLLPDTTEDQAKRALAQFFGVGDPSAFAVFLTGREVPLRRNLERSEAFRLYRQLRAVGLICEVRPVATASPEAQSVLSQEAAATRQASAPNVFALRPAVPDPGGPQRPERTRLAALLSGAISATLVVLVLAIALRFPAAPSATQPPGPLALATLDSDELLILTSDALLLHARSGLAKQRITARSLGLERLDAPLFVARNGDLLVNGAHENGRLQLQRCQLELRLCANFFPSGDASEVSALASSLLGDTLFLLRDSGELLRSSASGQLLATTRVPKPWGHPRLLASDGLLLIPSADGPLLDVLRPEAERFGEQLDALLLMPAEAVSAGQNRIQDIVLTPESGWALLGDKRRNTSLFHFDAQWGSPERIALPQDTDRRFMHVWRNKLLIAGPSSASIARYSLDGRPEAAFVSTLLATKNDNAGQWSKRNGKRRELALHITLISALGFAVIALLNGASVRASRKLPQQRSALLDPLPHGIRWRQPTRGTTERLCFVIGVVALLLLGGLCILLSNGQWLAAIGLGPVTLGSGLAWRWLRLGGKGRLGNLDSRVIVVDFDGRYFYGDYHCLRGNRFFVFAPELAVCGALPQKPGQTGDGVSSEYFGVLSSLGTLWQLKHPAILALLALLSGGVLSSYLLLWTQI